ncbi:DUF2798 domain-containing protein [Fulvivirga ulvae]|uniref:DUF2798 domain-containing protein n=1 Tax=Fulvivirga ulvae TaxID=2904245 RepID=UPI001F48F6C6|nr:DUF2798 domain-containing protein [Fulvivirga ulvae]UII31159.1 DUF2798 domain-containing protein [Fulvivirga ulvae]
MKRKILFAMIMGIITTGAISLLVIAVNTDLSGLVFLRVWLKSWGMAYLVIIPCILFIGPPVERIVDFILKKQ